MKDRLTSRERMAWVAVVAVLATSLLWFATAALAMTLQTHGADLVRAIGPALAVGRALVRALRALTWHGNLVLIATLAAAGITGMLVRAPRSGRLSEGSMHHG